jgi:hypothetical protein
MPDIAWTAPELTGETGLTLYLYTTAGVLINTDGDALSESPASSGRFVATVAESISSIASARLHDAVGPVRDGWLPVGSTLVQDEYPVSSSGGDATLAKQAEILAAIQGSAVIQVASPNVLGNLVLTQGDDYDGVANPRAQWTVTTDYTSGWTVNLTIRDTDDAVVYTNTGSVVSATVVAVTIAAPTKLTMTGCPGQWQGKFDVELTHSSGAKKTIALGTCYINEDQTR